MRMLNSVEKAWLYIGEKGSANAIRCFRVSGPLRFPLVEKCFNAMLDVFPILSARIVREDSFEYFKHSRNKPTVVHRYGDFGSQEIAALVENLLNRPIDPRLEPLIEFVFLESPVDEHWIVVNSHHAISDGSTKVAFMNHFLKLCDASLESAEAFQSRISSLKAVQEWSPSLTRGFPQQGVVAKYSGLLSFMTRRMIKEATHCCVRVDSRKHAASRMSRVLQYRWDAQFVELLRRIGKVQGLTVHALFCAALMKAFKSARFPADRTTDISCISFVNMRNQCVPAISERAIGCYISAAFTFHHVNESSSLLALAKDLSVQLNEASLRDVKQQAAYASLMARAMLAIGRRTVATLSVSNIGKVTQPLTSKKFRVTEAHVHSALTGIGSNLSVGLTTIDEIFAVDFTFVEGTITHHEVARIADLTRELLKNHLQSEPRTYPKSGEIEVH